MSISVFVFFGICIFTAGLTLVVKKYAVRIGGLDQPDNDRKHHVLPVPSLGGIAIYIGFMGGLVSLEIFQVQPFLSDVWLAKSTMGIIIAGTMIFLLGVYDDLRGANAVKKFTIQIAAATVLFAFDFRIVNISYPFGSTPDDFMTIGWLSYPLTIIWLVGISNAINLIDGHDGLAGGIVFFASMTLMTVSILQGNEDTTWILLILSASVLGFLVWNFPPASIFMGDSGSLFLGFIIAALALQSSVKGPASVTLLMPIALLALPVTDTFISILRRFLTGKPLVNADRGHIHHKLLEHMAMSRWKTLGLLYGISLLGCTVGLVTFLVPNALKWLPPVLLVGAMAWLLYWLGYGTVLKSGMYWQTWREGLRVCRNRRKRRKIEEMERMT